MSHVVKVFRAPPFPFISHRSSILLRGMSGFAGYGERTKRGSAAGAHSARLRGRDLQRDVPSKWASRVRPALRRLDGRALRYICVVCRGYAERGRGVSADTSATRRSPRLLRAATLRPTRLDRYSGCGWGSRGCSRPGQAPRIRPAGPAPAGTRRVAAAWSETGPFRPGFTPRRTNHPLYDAI